MSKKLFAVITAIVAIGLLGGTAALADDAQPLAPPDAAQQNSVFNWTEVPANQKVPLERATFDQGGYQLYDTQGETVIVPFTNDNLYVMKFAKTDDSQMYFINTGACPVLYVPDGAYLENATVSGSRWYPFTDTYHPATPVYLGIAPTWDAYIAMGWYPGMYCHGGYWSHASFWAGDAFVAMPGFAFWIGGHPYYGWDTYFGYYRGHPGWHAVGFYHPAFYHWAAHPWAGHPEFRGAYAHGDWNHGGDAAHGGDSFHGDGGFNHGAGGGNWGHGGGWGH